MIYFAGTSFAANHLRGAAREKGLLLTKELKKAGLVFISEDTPIGSDGRRNLARIETLIHETVKHAKKSATLVLTSQVPPGFTRKLNLSIYHQAETLRVKDAAERALTPEQIIVGCKKPFAPLPKAYLKYLIAFNCPVFQVTWEDAEFSKIAINMTLASQVDNTNRLASAAKKCGADWESIVTILQHDKRIGPHSYLTPGDWRDSRHLMRDWHTLEEIENG